MDDIQTMWQKRLPIAVIATEHQMKRKDVIAELGDLYSKNEAHYRANEYRDAQRLVNFAKWYDNHFDVTELQDAINHGALQDYWRKIAKPEKLTVPAVRDFVTTKLGTLPERTTSRSRYEPETYRLGTKSAYFGREQELIDMWQVNQLSIEAISRKTGVSKRALSKLLKPRGYDSHQIRSQIATERNKVRTRLNVKSRPVQAPTVPSNYQNKVHDILTDLNVDFITQDQHLGFKLDFYMPTLKLAINCLPLNAVPETTSLHNHADKYKIARQNGIQLITLFEKHFVPDVWINKTVPMLRRLVTGHADVTLYARQIDIRLMSRPKDKTLADAFLERYHMDGKTPARIRYGLFHQNELVGVATFGLPATPSYKDGETLELKRLAFKSDTQVRYGISKVVARLAKDYPEYTRLMTYSNNNMGRGVGYERAGFTFVKETGAQLTFVNPKDPLDTYSWSVATTWGAKSGVIAKLLGSQDVTNAQARQLVETTLPHRTDDGVGYVAFYDTGNKLWVKTLHE